MNNNKSKPVPPAFNTGVLFEYRGSETSGSKAFSVIMGTVLSYVIALALSFGALLTFTTMFSIPFYSTGFLIIAAIYAFAMMVVFQLPKKAVGFTSLGILAVLIITALIFWNETSSGFGYVKDFVAVGIAKSMYWTVPELSYTFSNAMKVDTTFVLGLIAVPLITGVCYFTIRKINFVLAFLITFPFFEIGAAFGCVPDHFCFSALLAGWTGIFAMHAAAMVRKVRKRRRDKKKTKTTASKRKQSLIASIGLIVAVITFGVFSFGNFMVSVAGYDRPEDMKELRANFKDTVSDFIDYITGIDNDGSMREGKLYQMGDRVIKDRRYMTVEVPFRQQIYLRGYVAGNYAGDRWVPNESTSETEWLESVYESSGYYPQSMQGMLLKEMEERNTIIKKSAATVSVSNLRRKKDYAYTAYIPLINSNFTLSGDSMVTPVNKSEYSYNAYMDDANFFMMNMSNLYVDNEFSSIWKEYTKYVKETYTDTPTAYAEVGNIVDDLVNGTGEGYKSPSYSNLQTADRIREWLKANMEYSLTVEKLPSDTDFVKWFVLENKKGYAAHFATAMAVMCRMAGIPTRYVEGYVITPEDFSNATQGADGYYTMDLTDVNAHAWIEIYETNYGWISIEATPGFYTGSLLDGITQNVDQSMNTTETMEEYKHNPESDLTIYADLEEEVEKKEEDEEEKEDDSIALSTILKVFKYILLFVGVAIGSFIAMVLIGFSVLAIRRSIRLSSLDKAIQSGDYEQRVSAIYKYYSRLLKFENIQNTEQLPYMKYAELICNTSTRLRGEQHLRAMSIFLKHRFSNESISENELKCLENLCVEYRKNSIAQISGKEKFRFKFFENLG